MTLCDVIPGWFSLASQGHDFLEGTAKLPGSVWSESGIELRIELEPKPTARELIPGTRLPPQCPERHILSDAHFCMALKASVPTDSADAARWWDDLAQYLMCQSVAERTGLWPLHNGLDHGEAGHFHAAAIDLAEELGILDEYFSVHDKQCPAFSLQTQSRLRHSRRFRRLLVYERARSAAVQSFEFTAAMSGIACCGSMRACPYLKAAPPKPSPLQICFREQLMSTTALKRFLRNNQQQT